MGKYVVGVEYSVKESIRDEWALVVCFIIALLSMVSTRNPLSQQYKIHCCHDMVLCHRA